MVSAMAAMTASVSPSRQENTIANSHPDDDRDDDPPLPHPHPRVGGKVREVTAALADPGRPWLIASHLDRGDHQPRHGPRRILARRSDPGPGVLPGERVPGVVEFCRTIGRAPVPERHVACIGRGLGRVSQLSSAATSPPAQATGPLPGGVLPTGPPPAGPPPPGRRRTGRRRTGRRRTGRRRTGHRRTGRRRTGPLTAAPPPAAPSPVRRRVLRPCSVRCCPAVIAVCLQLTSRLRSSQLRPRHSVLTHHLSVTALGLSA